MTNANWSIIFMEREKGETELTNDDPRQHRKCSSIFAPSIGRCSLLAESNVNN